MRGICRRVLLFILMLGTIFMYQTVFAEENVKKNKPNGMLMTWER